MGCQIAQCPYILYETAAMLYKFVNNISCRSMLSLHLGSPDESEWSIRQADELQQILEDSCKGLSPSDPRLLRFFSAVSTDDGQEGACLAYLMIFSFFTLRDPDFTGSIEAIRTNHRLLCEKGAWISGCSLLSLEFSCGEDCPGDDLDQICRLDLPADFRIELCRALRHFDSTLDELAELMRPIAEKLERNLSSAKWLWEEKISYWTQNSPLDYVSDTVGRDVFSGEDRDVLAAIFVMNHNFLLLKDSESTPDRSYLYIGCGASIRSQKRDKRLTCEMMGSALKAISDKRRLEILCRLSESRAYSLELAEAMGVDPSNMSRSLSQLCSYGFLKQEREGQKNFYETDRAAVRHFLHQLERFILN